MAAHPPRCAQVSPTQRPLHSGYQRQRAHSRIPVARAYCAQPRHDSDQRCSGRSAPDPSLCACARWAPISRLLRCATATTSQPVSVNSQWPAATVMPRSVCAQWPAWAVLQASVGQLLAAAAAAGCRLLGAGCCSPVMLWVPRTAASTATSGACSEDRRLMTGGGGLSDRAGVLRLISAS